MTPVTFQRITPVSISTDTFSPPMCFLMFIVFIFYRMKDSLNYTVLYSLKSFTHVVSRNPIITLFLIPYPYIDLPICFYCCLQQL